MTPPRLVQLGCPGCHRLHFERDSDFRGASLVGEQELSYPQRIYHCPKCQRESAGFRVRRKGPVLASRWLEMLWRFWAAALSW